MHQDRLNSLGQGQYAKKGMKQGLNKALCRMGCRGMASLMLRKENDSEVPGGCSYGPEI